MVDLSDEMAELWGVLGAPLAGRARAIQFVGATAGEGTSTVAREFAWHAATRAGRRTWLVDLDLMASSQAADIAADAKRYGGLGPPVAASPDGSAFFTVQPPLRRPDGRPWPDARYLSAHAVGGTSLWVTQFRRDALRGRQTVHILPTADYWNALRRHADLIVIDAPPADRSQAGLTVAPFIDDTVLVVTADQADVRAPARLRDAIHGAGGACAGLFFNRASVEPPKFLKGVLP
ncbi:MAG TPA: sugar kinase [Caulobacteraceae bacterium]|nr:sugar kinase [Caulobacteraceae bacterium]